MKARLFLIQQGDENHLEALEDMLDRTIETTETYRVGERVFAALDITEDEEVYARLRLETVERETVADEIRADVTQTLFGMFAKHPLAVWSRGKPKWLVWSLLPILLVIMAPAAIRMIWPHTKFGLL